MVLEYPRLEEMTLRQLRRVASEYRIPRYSRMRKLQLLAAIQRVDRERLQLPFLLPREVSQTEVEASKYELGSRESSSRSQLLGSVDRDLAELPVAYDDSRVVLMPRDPYLCYAYWEISAERWERMQQERQTLYLRLCDAGDGGTAGNLQEYRCEVGRRELYLPVPLSDRDYFVELGYRRPDGAWTALARSAAVRVPPVYPSAWVEDCFVTLDWDRDLQQQTIPALQPPQTLLPLDPSALERYPLGDLRLLAEAGSLFAYDSVRDSSAATNGEVLARLVEPAWTQKSALESALALAAPKQEA